MKDRGSNETLSKIERFSNLQKYCPGQRGPIARGCPFKHHSKDMTTSRLFAMVV